MAHKIDEIEGIAPTYSGKFHEIGIETTDDLLNKCSERKARDEIAGKIGIDKKMLLKWTNTADLFRIRGIGKQYSELLEASGVETIEQLSKQEPQKLSGKFHEVNARRKYSKITPSPHIVERWIEQARNIEMKIHH